MDCERIRIEEVDMKLANWLANNIILEETEKIEQFISSGIVEKIIRESSGNTSAQASPDDGPTTFFKTNSKYKNKNTYVFRFFRPETVGPPRPPRTS